MEISQDFARMCQLADVENSITFIGGGNMAQAIIKGFVNSGVSSAQNFFIRVL